MSLLLSLSGTHQKMKLRTVLVVDGHQSWQHYLFFVAGILNFEDSAQLEILRLIGPGYLRKNNTSNDCDYNTLNRRTQ